MASPLTPSSLLENLPTIGDKYSDYTLVCDGQEFKVHRVVLGGKRIFAQPRHAHTLNLPYVITDIDPDVVQAMRDHFYKFAYDVPEGHSALLFHVKVFAMADFFECAGLLRASEDNFEEECKGIDSFKEECKGEWSVADFFNAVRAIDSHPTQYQPLREIAISTMRRHLSRFLCSDGLSEFIAEKPGWIIELLRFMDNESKTATAGMVPSAQLHPNGPYGNNAREQGVSER